MTRPPRTHALRLLIAWAVLSVVGVVIGLQLSLPPGDQSQQSVEESSLLKLMTIISTPVFVGVVLFILYAAFAFRQKRGAVEDGPASYGNIRVQVAWVAITAVIVFILAGIGISQLDAAATGTNFASSSDPSLATTASVGTTEAKALQVQVIAQQWFFTYRYADYSGVESLHLILPDNANVVLHITSTDILHSFWAYQLGVKADANPGVDNITYLTTLRTGYFTVRCAELCGIWHGNMADTNGQVVSQSDFAGWIGQLQKDNGAIPVPSYAPYYFPSPRVKGT